MVKAFKKKKKGKLSQARSGRAHPALRRQRQVDLSEFRVSLVYGANSRIARATQRNPVLTLTPKKGPA